MHSDLPGFTDSERIDRHAVPLSSQVHAHPQAYPFQTLDPDTRRAVNLLVPLLRIADSLDRSHEQRVGDLQVQFRNGSVTLALGFQTRSGPRNLGRRTRGRRIS